MPARSRGTVAAAALRSQRAGWIDGAKWRPSLAALVGARRLRRHGRVSMCAMPPERLAHHPQHLETTTLAEVADDERGREREKDDVEDGRVVPARAGISDFGVPRARRLQVDEL